MFYCSYNVKTFPASHPAPLARNLGVQKQLVEKGSWGCVEWWHLSSQFSVSHRALDAGKNVKYKDTDLIQGGEGRLSRDASPFIPARMKDIAATVKQEYWEDSACMKERKERIILGHVINNAWHHLSKNILILTKAQHHGSHTSEVTGWHVMHSGVLPERIKSMTEIHLSVHNCHTFYKNIFQFRIKYQCFLFSTNCFYIVRFSDLKLVLKQ